MSVIVAVVLSVVGVEVVTAVVVEQWRSRSGSWSLIVVKVVCAYVIPKYCRYHYEQWWR